MTRLCHLALVSCLNRAFQKSTEALDTSILNKEEEEDRTK
jgi:hypothetical protein